MGAAKKYVDSATPSYHCGLINQPSGFGEDATPDQHQMVAKAVDLINDWLPLEHRMVMGPPTTLRTEHCRRCPGRGD